MKTLIALLLLCSVPAAAGGRLTFSPGYSLKHKNLIPVAGLSIYQKLFAGFALNTWHGVGDALDPKDARVWATSKNMLEFTSGDVTVSAGVQFNYLFSELELNPVVKMGFGYQLW